MFINVANRAQIPKYVAFVSSCFGRNIGGMNRSPTKSKALSHPDTHTRWATDVTGKVYRPDSILSLCADIR